MQHICNNPSKIVIYIFYRIILSERKAKILDYSLRLLKAAGNYQILSNRESGEGRTDIIMQEPKFRGKAVIMEIKLELNVVAELI